MIKGNVNAALRLLSENANAGILPRTDDTIKKFYEEHPQAESLRNELLMHIDPVIFYSINADLIQKIGIDTKGYLCYLQMTGIICELQNNTVLKELIYANQVLDYQDCSVSKKLVILTHYLIVGTSLNPVRQKSWIASHWNWGKYCDELLANQ